MSIHDYLSEEQINKINTVILIQCEQAAHNDAVERNRISADLYNKLKKGRKAHDLTGDIYVALFYQENTIEGLKLELTSNGISAEETKKSEETEKGSEEETKAGEETKATDETKTSEESKSAAETEKSSETEASRDSSVVVTGEEIRLPLLLSIAAISLLSAAGLAIVRKRR